jgi:hypothetical protein
MTTLIFAHSPLTGPSAWRAVAEIMQRTGFTVRTPALTDALTHPMLSGPPYYPKLAGAIAAAARGCDAPLLVAHSGGGALLPSVVQAMNSPPIGAIFVDALLPHPGKSWMETAPALQDQLRAMARDALLPPWSGWFPEGAIRALFPDDAGYAAFVAELPRAPIAYLEERAPHLTMGSTPCAYLQLSAGYAREAGDAERDGWRVQRLDLSHLSLITAPDVVAQAIGQLAAALQIAR